MRASGTTTSARIALFAPLSEARSVEFDGGSSLCHVMVALRKFLHLWRDCSGSSLIEYSFLITITIALVVLGVSLAGAWAANMWTNLLATLP
jgi:Flp pilus assembly pilin Flp